MPLEDGQNLSHYEVLGPLGRGGMGEVYRARDTKLGREVAIKVLPSDLARDEERLRRFEREARTLASLNHPNVGGIHGVDQDGEVCFLALELVPGEDLGARLARGALPVDEAIQVCRQIAEGLESAHEAGVVHRDLKPANIRITPEGVVKILDFGLAKPIRPKTREGGTSAAEPDSFLLTEEGLLLGTPTYMSPEQARGKSVDRRTDIWAFGCVFYECLTGKRPFEGESLTDVLASIIGEEPDLTHLPQVSTRLRELLVRCLTKEPRARLRDIGEARVQLEDPDVLAGEEAFQPAEKSSPPRAVALLGVLGLLLAALWAGRFLGAPVEESVGPIRFKLEDRIADRGQWGGNLLAVSRDASTIAYVGVPEDSRLHLRALESFEAWAVPETEGATAPFFSPDGTEVAYWSDGKLMRVPVVGGRPSLLANTSRLHEACWGPNDSITVVEFGRMLRIDPGAGTTREVVKNTRSFVDSPSSLPGGERVLFDHEYQLCAVVADGTWRELGRPGTNPAWSSTGHVFFQALDKSIWAASFDPDALTFETEPVQLVDQPVLDFDVAADGTLIYIPGLGSAMELVWVDRKGDATPLDFETGHYLVPRLSPNDRRLAVSIQEAASDHTDLWVLELDRGARTRITTDGQWNTWAVWTHAATRLAYMGDGYLWSKSSDGTGEAQRLTDENNRNEVPISWNEGQRALAFYAFDQAGELRILYDEGGVQDFLSTPFDERSPHFSPDGRWIAYVSDQSGNNEVYVRPHSKGQAPDRRFAISTGGGGEPCWSRVGSELFYRRGTQMFSVSFKAGPTPEVGVPQLLFDRPYLTHPVGRANPNYDVAADGRFLMIRVSDSAATSEPVVHVVRGLEALARR